MKNKNRMTLILSVIVCLLPILLGIALYSQLPEQMPIHFTVGDAPDNYAPKNFALFGIPIIMAVFQAITVVSTRKKLQENETPKIAKIMEWFIPIVTVAIYVIMVEVPLKSGFHVGKSILLILGIAFTVMGNYLPKMSYEVGKKTVHPAPKSEKSFRKMTKITGYSFIGIGILFLIMMIWA